jgi:hypothetical protein
VAALAGIGLVALWRDYRQSVEIEHPVWWKGWALPLTLLGTALVQAHVLSAYSGAGGWPAWLAPFILAATVLVAAALILGRLGLRFLVAPDLLVGIGTRSALALAVGGTFSLLVAPAAWAAVSVADGNGAAWLPQAGPGQRFGGGFGGARPARAGGPGSRVPGGFGFQGRSFSPPANGSFRGFAPGGFRGSGPSGGFARGFGGGGFGGAITFAGKQTPKLDPKLLRYLETHKGKARYLVATTTSTYASLLILQTGQPIMALGGYQGWDRIGLDPVR